jgi:hypothetical protein
MSNELDQQAQDRIKHPAEWNSWYLYAKSRQNDTLNKEELAIAKKLWSMTTTMDKMVEEMIIARRKSL